MSRYQRLIRRNVLDLEREIEALTTKHNTIELNIEFMKLGPYLGIDLGVSIYPLTNKEYIYISKIYDCTAAKIDGRLKTGDKILSVNGSDISFYAKPEVVELLRSIENGEKLNITVQRSIENDKKPRKKHPTSTSLRLLRPLRCGSYEAIDETEEAESSDNSDRVDNKRKLRKQSTFHVSSSMSLLTRNSIFGIPKANTKFCRYHFKVPFNLTDGFESVLGFNMNKFSEKDTNTTQIYISSILKGGAAWKDARLLPGDEIVALQGIDLETGERYEPEILTRKRNFVNRNFLKEFKLKVKSDEGLFGDPYNKDILDLLYAKVNQLKKAKELNEIIEHAVERPLLFAKLFINEVSQIFDSLSIVVRREESNLSEEPTDISESYDTVNDQEDLMSRKRKISAKQKLMKWPQKIFASFRKSSNISQSEDLKTTIQNYKNQKHKDSISLDETFFRDKPLLQNPQFFPKFSASIPPPDNLYVPLSPSHFQRLTSNYAFFHERRNNRDKPKERKLRHTNSLFSI